MAGSSDIVYLHPRYEYLDQSLKDILFDPEKLQSAGLITRELKGRGTTYFYKLLEQPVVLRHYWRGGFMRHLSKDSYLWTGLTQTRSYREWKLLKKMEALDLPTPRAVAMRIQRGILCYRSDIVTEEIEGVISLAHLLKQRAATNEEWQRVGQTIRRFHQMQVFHADLNANNILLSDNACYWIDFDRGSVRSGSDWQESVLARLRRSLDKLRRLHDPFHFNEDGWAQLLEAYQQ